MDCIHPTPEEIGFDAAEQLFIDPSICIDCDMCVAECPVQAIYQDADVPAEWQEFIERNRKHYADSG
jgi:NAD-dependent dihydropyrimidine dehydrogenase PreA subunit